MTPYIDHDAGKKTHIFIIDSDKELLVKLSLLFSHLPVKVCCYNDAESFLSLPSIPPNSCLLLEVELPGKNGLDLMEDLLSEGCMIPMIAWSASSDIPTAVRAMKANAIDFIEKPIIESLLLKQVEKAMKNLVH
jgi:two-component system response regulator FixJ